MGYETKMIVVIKNLHMKDHTALIDGQVFKIFPVKNSNTIQYIYYPDRKTETPVPQEAVIKEGHYCQDIAILDLCNCGDTQMPGICKTYQDTDGSYVYEPFDGNKLIGPDSYGDFRSFIPIDQVITILDNSLNESRLKGEIPLRRFAIALTLLNQIRLHFPNNSTQEIGCLFYGH